jgi:hypothetical protein
MASEPFKLQNDYHQRATGFIRQALEFDEQSSILFSQKISPFYIFVN